MEILNPRIKDLLWGLKEKNTVALMKDGTLSIIKPETKATEVEKFVGAGDIQKLLVKELFGKDVLGEEEYSSMLLVMKIVHENTPSTKKNATQSSIGVQFINKKAQKKAGKRGKVKPEKKKK